MNPTYLIKWFKFKQLRQLLGLTLLGLLLWQLESTFKIEGPGQVDLLEYWAAAKLIENSENPYDAARIEEIQKAEPTTGATLNNPILMWNPPFVIPVIKLLGELDFHEARIAWLMVTFACLFISIFCIFLGNINTHALSWKPVVALISFFPIVSILQFGQISWILILGLTICGLFINRYQGLLAGLALSLCLIKPHLLYLTYLSFFIYLPSNERLKFILGFTSGAALLGGSAEIISPGAWSQWLAAFERPPVYFKTPTVGSLLNRLLEVQHGWILYIPALLTLITLALFRGQKWCQKLIKDPVTITAISLATAPYGWIFDQVLLLPLVIRLTMRPDFWIPATTILLNLLGFAPWMPAQDDYWWYPISLVAIALLSQQKIFSQISKPFR
jgi:hypothetical protein